MGKMYTCRNATGEQSDDRENMYHDGIEQKPCDLQHNLYVGWGYRIKTAWLTTKYRNNVVSVHPRKTREIWDLAKTRCIQRTWASMFAHCCSSETGGLPRLVANWTRSSCSFWAVLPLTAWSRATAANHVDSGSMLKSPPHSNWPADIVFTVIRMTSLF